MTLQYDFSDLTLTDVQYQLLLLQLKYVRGLLRENFHSNTEIFQNKINKDEQICTSPTTDRNVRREDELYPGVASKPASTEIYTMNKSIAGLNSAKKSSSVEDMSKNLQVMLKYFKPYFKIILCFLIWLTLLDRIIRNWRKTLF